MIIKLSHFLMVCRDLILIAKNLLIKIQLAREANTGAKASSGKVSSSWFKLWSMGYGGPQLLVCWYHRCKMQHNYDNMCDLFYVQVIHVNMQEIDVNMRENCVDVQLIYVKMWVSYVNMQIIYVNMRDNWRFYEGA